jgi:TyrR family helix-turn-helix protein
MRIGSTKVKKVDVRFIAATNRNLEEAVKKGAFRSDLYYRLRVAVLDLPPLRERREEILPLVNLFLDRFNTKYKKSLTFSDRSMRYLQNYNWPGNVREMENLIQGLVVTQDKDLIDVTDLPCYQPAGGDKEPDLLSAPGGAGELSLREIMDNVEKDLLKRALDLHGSVSKVAKALQVDRTTIFRKLKKYNLM